MLTIWRADFDGDKAQFEKVDRKLKEIGKQHGVQTEGPFFPQDTTLLYLIQGPPEKLNAGGPEFLRWLQQERIALTPVRFEIAQTQQEFGWP